MHSFLFRRDMPARSRCPSRPRLPLRELCQLDDSVRDFTFSDLRELIASAAEDPNTIHSVVAVIGDFRDSSLR